MSDDAPRPLRHYGVVRRDLPLGQKFAQLGHAFGESAVLGTPPDDKTIACALEGSSEQMLEAMRALGSRNIPYVVVTETDGAFAGQLVAFGVEPTADNRVRKILYHFGQCGTP